MIGEIAGLCTSIAWSFTSIFFTIAANRVGAITVNRLRLLIASGLLLMFHLFLYGNIVPSQVEGFRWWWLSISAVMGLIVGDTMLLRAFVLVGTRVTMLLLSFVPIISTILAWIYLKEILKVSEILAIFVTIAGIVWVVLEKGNDAYNVADRKNYFKGILMGLGGAFCQALALITAKKALGGNFPALTATLIRILVATTILWVIAIFQRSVITNLKLVKKKYVLNPIFGGSFFGPFLGIWLSLIAIKYAHIGIASTLMALPPIFLLPLTYWIFKERITLRSVVGTVAAVGGIAIIFLA